jgi:hypothetical protein
MSMLRSRMMAGRLAMLDVAVPPPVIDDDFDLDDYGLSREPVPKARELRRIGPVMDAFIASNAFIKGIMGPVGSGKTIGVANFLLQLAARQKGKVNARGQIIRKARFAMIRDTYPNLDRNTIPSWFKVVPRHMGRFVASSPRIHEFSFALQRDGHLLDHKAKPTDIVQVQMDFRAIGDQTVEDALRGLEVLAALVNEADRTHPDIVTFLAGRVGRFSDDLDTSLAVDPCIMLDLNGNDDENWTHKLLIEEELPDGVAEALMASSGGRKLIEYFQQPEAVDAYGNVNPRAENVENLPPGYYQRQFALAKMRGNQTYIDRMLRSKFTPSQNGRSVFPEYFDEVHSGEFEAIPGIPLLVFADQGLLGGVLIGQMVKGQLRILAEIACVFETEDDVIEVAAMGGETLGRQVKELLAEMFPGFRIADAVCDPAGAAGEDAINFTSWRQDFQKGLGHRVRKARVPRNAIEPRLKAVRMFLNGPIGDQRKLLIHKRCKMLRRAFRTKYYYQRVGKGSGDGVYADKPKKVQGYGDLMDALQYGCFEINRGLDLSADGETRIGHRRREIENDSAFDVLRGSV